MKREKAPPIPAEQSDSIRHRIISLLRESENSARDLSAAIHIPEKEVYDHLSHIRKSSDHLNLTLVIRPAFCKRCGFTFVKRRKLKKPSKCPACSSERIEPPRFEIKEI